MLKTLKNRDTREAERILSSVTATLLPNPGIESKSEVFEHSLEFYDDIIQEIRKRLKIAPSDYSPESMAKIYQFLSQQMSEVALANTDLDLVKTRLGHRGDLRPDLYEIRFHKSFPIAERYGIRQNHILDALRHPDAVEHLLPERFSRDNIAVSLYLKTPSKQRNDRFSLLVLTQREGFIQQAGFACRVYHSDMDLSRAQGPFDILRGFVDRYGLFLNVGPLRAKFFLYEVLQLDQDIKIIEKDIKEIIRAEAPHNTQVMYQLWARKSGLLNLIEIAIAFAINYTEYVIDLRKHGVQVEN